MHKFVFLSILIVIIFRFTILFNQRSYCNLFRNSTNRKFFLTDNIVVLFRSSLIMTIFIIKCALIFKKIRVLLFFTFVFEKSLFISCRLLQHVGQIFNIVRHFNHVYFAVAITVDFFEPSIEIFWDTFYVFKVT